MTLNISNLFYSEQNIGLNLHMSKRQFIWGFDLDGKSHHIKLLDSRLSHKKRLYKNGDIILKTVAKGNFSHDFEVGGHHCTIIQYGDTIELRIDNQSFTHLYNLQKNKELFAGEKCPTSKVNVVKSNNIYGTNNEKKVPNNGEEIYKKKEEKKPKLFNFKIKKDNGRKSTGLFNSKFTFGGKKEKSFPNSINNQYNTIDVNDNENSNKDHINLLENLYINTDNISNKDHNNRSEVFNNTIY